MSEYKKALKAMETCLRIGERFAEQKKWQSMEEAIDKAVSLEAKANKLKLIK